MESKEHKGRTLYKIDNHPDNEQIERYVSWAGLDIKSDENYGKFIKLQFRLWVFIGETEIPIPTGATYVDLVATNSSFVNQMGEIVPEGTEGAIGEYDFFIALLPNPVIIMDFILAKIQWANAMGRFNTF